MMHRKAWKNTLFTLLLVTIISSSFFLYQWDHFTPVAMKDSELHVQEESPQDAAGAWMKTYMKQYKGILVPYSMQIKDVEIQAITPMKTIGFYQVDYILYTKSTNWQLAANLEASKTKDNTYTAQQVLQLGNDEDGYYVQDVMRPVQYQIQYELDPQEYQQPIYAMQDKEQTYLLENERLSVTYDHGATFHNVPVPYEDITRTPQQSYAINILQEGSYLVDKEYTAFLYTKADRSLWIVYSFDEGITWEHSELGKELSQRVKYISKTPSYTYVLTASDKAMSAEGHALFRSTNGKNFEAMDTYHDPQSRLMTYAVFVSDEVGYVAYTKLHSLEGTNNDVAVFYRTVDGGASFTEITLPKHEVTVLEYTHAPFVQVERIYEEEGEIHVIVGQGDTGDYGTKDGLYKAHYKSSDGYQFSFVEELIEKVEMAG